EYEAFYDDHVKEISSGSTTTHFDSSRYNSFIFDLLINLFPPADRSDFYEFTDELAHNISPPKYDCFCFKNEPNSGDFTMDVVEDIFPTREPRVHNALPTDPTFQLNLDFILFSESLFSYVSDRDFIFHLLPYGTMNLGSSQAQDSVNKHKRFMGVQFEDFSDSNDDSTSYDDDSFSIDNIDGSTTTRTDISLPEYEAFYDDHVKEISSGSTTTHSNCSLYDSFIFDLSINPFPPAGRSDFYEFADELTHIISPPEYDCFCFNNEPNLGDFTMDVVENIIPTREPRVYNGLSTHPPFQLNMDFILSSESLFAYVVWIFIPFLSYSVAPKFILSFGNEDTIFDPDICS
nr:hypothetical protein [Tanacetum cinerariifolium]